jgi:hypothetical protein
MVKGKPSMKLAWEGDEAMPVVKEYDAMPMVKEDDACPWSIKMKLRWIPLEIEMVGPLTS